MKILHVIPFKDAKGGSERVAYELTETLVSHGHKVAIINLGDQTGLSTKDNIQYLSLGMWGSDWRDLPRLSQKDIKQLFKFLDDSAPETIHAHNFSWLEMLVQAWARFNKVPFFLTVHIMPSKLYKLAYTNKAAYTLLKSPLPKAYLLSFMSECSGVVALNETVEKDILGLGYKGKTFRIPNARKLEKYSHLSIAPNTKKKRLIYIGSISQHKNQCFLIETLNNLPKTYSLEIIGSSADDKYYDELHKYIAQNQLEDRVIFTGQIPAEEVPAHLENKHAFFSGSTLEVQSLVIIEALASGTPVVGLSNETTEELIDDSVGLLLAKETKPKEAAKELRKLLETDYSRYLELCQNSRERVKEFDWENVAKRTVQMYKTPYIRHTKRSKLLKYFLENINNPGIESFLQDNLGEQAAKEPRVKSRPLLLLGLALGGSALILGTIVAAKRIKKQ